MEPSKIIEQNMSVNAKDLSSPSSHSNARQSARANDSIEAQNDVCDLVEHLNLDSGSHAGQQSQSNSTASRLETSCSDNDRNEDGSIGKVPSRINRHFKQNANGDTHLHIAVRKKQIRLTLWLIDNAGQPSNLDIINKQSFTALHIAVMTRQANLIRKLVLAGANNDIATNTGYTALHLACDDSDVNSVEALTKPLNDEEKGWLASKHKDFPAIPTSLETTDKDGYTALHIAATHDNIAVVKQLISVGADLNAIESRFGRTPFHMAVENSCKKVIGYFIEEHNSCLNVLTDQGMSPYEIALNVDKQLAEDLLSLGAEPIVRDPDLYNSSEESSETNSDDDDFSDESDDDLRLYDNVAFFDNVALEP